MTDKSQRWTARTSIHILDDDSFLNIFYLYRLAYLGGDEVGEVSISNWRWWYKLAQICRRWRRLILGSASHLGLCLVCTNGTPIANMLAHSPPFPLIINFVHIHHDRDITAEDENGIVFALQQRNRVRHIRFRMGVRNLQRITMVIGEEYPMLESLVVLHPTRDNSVNLILPQSFRAPHLRRLVLSGVAFPTKSPLLTPVISRLVTLRLYFIHQSAYVRPNVLLQSLSIMPQLETLVVGFLFPVPNRDVEGQLLLTPIRTHVTLPNLRHFTFQGASSYLEALVRWATTPCLEKLGIVFFNELMFALPYLLQFIRTTESLKFHSALIEFSSVSIRVGVYSHEDREKWAFRMDVDCEQFDWQLSSMAQISSALRNAFSEVDHLILGVGRGSMLPDLDEEHHEIDRTEWHRLLSSFGNVKTVSVDYPLVAKVSHCLRSEDGDLPLELLPGLKELIYPGIDGWNPFESFIDYRWSIGRPVTLVCLAEAPVPSKVYSAQSADYLHPPGFVSLPSQRQNAVAFPPLPSSHGSADAWDPRPKSYSRRSINESRSRSPCSHGDIQVDDYQSSPPIIPAPLSQGLAGVQNAWVPFSQALRKPSFPEHNWSFMAAKKRKALVIGIDYSQHPDQDFKLRHCTVDAHEMASFLSTNLGFAPRDIRVMTDEMENSWDRPTKENILRSMQELVRDPRPGDSFFLYFSGHGLQIKDTSGDELDGLDECIFAMDYYGDDAYPTANTPGLIVDDDIHDILVRPLPLQSRLTALFDSCYSGMTLDLPYVYDSNGVVKPFRHIDELRVLRQKASRADVVSLGASKDNQRAQDIDRGGLLRCAFADSMKKFNNTLSYKVLIRSILDYMQRHGFQQKPQLSTSYEIDTNLPFIV